MSAVLWQANGKPRHGPLCDLMKTSRARFKQCLRQCRVAEEKAKADVMAKNFYVRTPTIFGKK